MKSASTTLAFLSVLLLFAGPKAFARGKEEASQEKGGEQACHTHPYVTAGGVNGFSSLADPRSSQQLRKSCKVGLYLHAEAWKVQDGATRARILATFKGTGPAVVELGYVDAPGGYFKNFYKPAFLDNGVKADVALINGLCHNGQIEGTLAYIQAAKQYGLSKVAIVFTPNSGQFKTSRFSDKAWDCVREAARTGGALAIDAPPHVFFALKKPYQQFVEDEIRWAKQGGIPAYYIISPNASQGRFYDEANRLLAELAASGAMPSNFVFETYDVQRADSANQVGDERSPGTVLGVTLRLLPKLP